MSKGEKKTKKELIVSGSKRYLDVTESFLEKNETVNQLESFGYGSLSNTQTLALPKLKTKIGRMK